MAKYLSEIGFETIACCNCGIMFALPIDYKNERMDDHEGFRCPNGHLLHFPQKSKEEELAEKLEKAQVCCDIYKNRVKNRDLTVRALKGHLTRRKRQKSDALA